MKNIQKQIFRTIIYEIENENRYLRHLKTWNIIKKIVIIRI